MLETIAYKTSFLYYCVIIDVRIRYMSGDVLQRYMNELI